MDKNKNFKKVPEIRFKGFTDDWEQRKLGTIVEFFSGLTYSPDNIVPEDGTFVLRSSNVKGGELVNADNVYVDSSVVNSSNVQTGDIVVVVRNGSRDLIGKHAQVKTDMENTVIGAFMTGIRSKESNFINALLDTQQFKIEINKNLGATINQITTGAFKKMLFSVTPNIEEQQKIGSFFKQLDNTIALHQRKLAKLKKLKQGYLQKMFPKNGSKFPQLRFSGFADAWEQRKLDGYLDEYTEKTTSEDQYPVLTSSQQQGIVFQTDYFANRQVTTSENIGYYVLPRGYFTYRSRSDNGVFKFNRNDLIDFGIISYFYPVFKIDNGDSNFFMQILNHSIIRQVDLESVGTGQRVLSMKKLRNIRTRIPSLDEQKKIGSLFAHLNETIALHQRKLEHLQLQKKSLLQKMFC